MSTDDLSNRGRRPEPVSGRNESVIAPSVAVYEQLRRKILDREIPPATRINVHAVAREFGVSPTPVREALRVLQGDKLVTSPSNRGYATTEVMSVEEISDLFEFRLIVEPWAASVVSGNRLANPGGQLLSDIERVESFIDSPTGRDRMIAHDTEFHNIVVAATRNSAAEESISNLHFHLHLFRVGDFEMDARAILSEHQEVARAIAAHDSEGASRAMRGHLLSAHERFCAQFPHTLDASEVRNNSVPAEPKFER